MPAVNALIPLGLPQYNATFKTMNNEIEYLCLIKYEFEVLLSQYKTLQAAMALLEDQLSIHRGLFQALTPETFPEIGTFQFAPKMGQISDEDRIRIDDAFDVVDERKNGWLNSYGFKNALAALGFDLSKPDYCRELEDYGRVPLDWRGPHTCPVNRLLIYPDQFRLCAAKLIAQQDPREKAIKVFNLFDYDQDGIISVKDMEQLAQDINEKCPMIEDEIEAMIDHLDHDGKGGVNFEEFLQMMESR
ncbi:hypothetical protein Trco_008537 [Trichoderma cornu-damae]|uniref:Calmodulin n=1 Tax=Trichoderma cornu-damae TaxID=654480 RepID=A0A9P8QES8_9HYPO|nr:hypothetical protein Trco_008537 [Trichoderma cornu-damae]